MHYIFLMKIKFMVNFFVNVISSLLMEVCVGSLLLLLLLFPSTTRRRRHGNIAGVHTLLRILQGH
jgi:hypothetical protein